MKNKRVFSTILVLLLAMLTVFSLAACDKKDTDPANTTEEEIEAEEAKFKTYTSQETGFEMSVPENWIDIPGSNDTSASMADPTGQRCFMLIEEPTADIATDLTLESYSDLLVQAMEQTGSATGLTSGDIAQIQIGSGNVDARSRELDATLSGINIRYLQVVFRSSGFYYGLYFWTVPSQYEEALPEFQKMLASIVVPQ